MPIKEKLGDLLSAEEDYIVQQSNCTTTYPAGLAAAISEKFPYADVYKKEAREKRGTLKSGDVPGTIAVLGGPAAASDKEREQRGIINMFGQFAPGKPNRSKTGPVTSKGITSAADVVDNAAQRLTWFQAGLQQIAELPGIQSIAFPYLIGCGLAGGDWSKYEQALEEFSKVVEPHGIEVVIYKLDDAQPCTDCKAHTTKENGKSWGKKWYCNSCYSKY
eukprot:TRINITY_DN111463_c0_g1_i1.p1 TRINITY_DN111463_c0_g1~~TRINITY_DN111463_c0_g1_i1.p1  ORF type:complete len:219 (+),score=49.59 TRINITY_DN111463_c0_g1_i1:71-727(+)